MVDQRELYKMLHALCRNQEMANYRDCGRSDANIMHFYLNSLEFAALYTKPFKDHVNPQASKREMNDMVATIILRFVAILVK